MPSKFGGIPVNSGSSRFGGVPVGTIQTPSNRAVSEQTAASIQPGQAQPKMTFMESLTGRGRTTPETEATPEISKLATGNRLQDLKISAGILATANPQAQIDIIKKAAPEAQIDTDQMGNTFVDFGGGKKYVLNKPGMSEVDILRTAAQIISFIPVGKMVNAIKSTLPRIFAGAGTAGLTEIGLQGAAKGLGSQEQIDLQSVGEAALLGGAAETIAPAIQAVKLAKQRKAIGASIPSEIVAPSVEAAEQAQAGLLKSTGVDVPLYPGQKTQLPTVLEKQAFTTQLPEGTRKATLALQRQNQAVSDVVNEYIKSIAPPESIITGPRRFRTAAQRHVKAMENIRDELSSPIYKESFKDQSIVNVDPVKKLVAQKTEEFPTGGEVNRTMKRIFGFLKGNTSIKKLHNVKLEIDQMLESFGDNALGKTTKLEVLEMKQALVELMDKANPAYKQARNEFAAASPGVTRAQESVLGQIALIPEKRLKTISQQIFDPAEMNPEILKNAKKAIKNQDPEAWNQLLRAEFERRLGSMKADISELQLTTENIPGQIYRAIFGNQRQRKVLFEAVDDEAKKNLKYIETVLRRASLGRVSGSQTAIREEIKKELRGSSRIIRDIFKSPIDTLVSVGEDTVFERNTKIMADMVFNPEWKPKMKQLRQIKTNNPASAKAMAQLIKEIEESMREK